MRDPDNAGFLVAPLDAETMDHLASFPLNDLRDPWDRLIVTTVIRLRLPLVTKDRAITDTGMVEVIW